MDERVRQARLLHERAVFGGDEGHPLAEADRVLDAVEADLAMARDRIMHTGHLGEKETAVSLDSREAD